MARITVIIITAALLVDFILLPSLLILVSKDSDSETTDTTETTTNLKN